MFAGCKANTGKFYREWSYLSGHIMSKAQQAVLDTAVYLYIKWLSVHLASTGAHLSGFVGMPALLQHFIWLSLQPPPK